MFPLNIPRKIVTSNDCLSGSLDLEHETEIPTGNHGGAFGSVRLHDVHTGIDLYALDGTPIYAITNGIVVDIFPFTGILAGCDWWLDTVAIAIEDSAGIWLYGEVEAATHLTHGCTVTEGEIIGTMKRVLKRDKGRPTSMLHLERYVSGCRTFAPLWNKGDTMPNTLIDPTPMILQLV